MQIRSSCVLILGILGLLSVLVVLAGCADTNIVRVVSDEPSIPFYIDAFNTRHPNTHVELTYVANINAHNYSAYDLIISRNLTPYNTEYLYPLHRLRSIPKVTQHMYAPLVETGQRNGRQYLLPLSFNVPIIVFGAQELTPQELGPTIGISLTQLRALAAANTIVDGEEYTALGFSPRWNSDFLYLLTRLYGADYRNAIDGPAWNEEPITQALDFTRTWIRSLHGGLDIELAFNTKYIQEPHYRLLFTGQVRFIYMDLASFYAIDLQYRRMLEYQLIYWEERFPVLEGILYVGVGRQSNNRPDARTIIRWLFNPNTQAALLEQAAKMRTVIFGIADGLSTLPKVNAIPIPQYYPRVLGKIPPADALVAWPYPLNEWDTIRNEVIEPWLQDVLAGDTQETLSREIELWLLSRE